MKYFTLKFNDHDKVVKALLAAGFESVYRSQGYQVAFKVKDGWDVKHRLHAVFTSEGLKIHQDYPWGRDRHHIRQTLSPRALRIIEKFVAKLNEETTQENA